MAASLPGEGESGRVGEAVHVRVTLDTGPAEDRLVGRQPGLGRVATFDVALLAEARQRELQHLFPDSAVRVMAVRAALEDRRVLPQEWAPLVGVALITVVVDGILRQERFRDSPVWVVARGAGHLPFAQRHMGVTVDLRAPDQVTLGTHLYHFGLGQLEAVRDLFHPLVAVRAGHVPAFVGTALPVGTLALLMTGEADGVLPFNGLGGLPPEGDQIADPLPPAGIGVDLARTMAGLPATEHQGGPGGRLGEEFCVSGLIAFVLA